MFNTQRIRAWRFQLGVLWSGSFVTELGNALTMPFLPLYIRTLGHFSSWELNILSAVAFGITYVAKTIVSPMWGRLADRHGRKPMCLRASGVMTLTIFANALVPNVWWLILVRAIQGGFSGYINNAQALMASEAPASKKGSALGTLATGSVTGTLIGPLVGGVVASQFGYRPAFMFAAAGMLLVFLATLILVHEDFKPVATPGKMPKTISLMSIVKKHKLLLAVYIVALTVQSASTTIQPIVSLFVAQLSGGRQVDLLSGVVTAAPGLAALLLSPLFGRVIDHHGSKIVLICGLWAATITLIPLLMVKDVQWLIGLRFIFGMSDAAIIPAYQTMMAEVAGENEFGQVFSYSQSFQAFGNVVGPLLGSVVASAFGYNSVFALTLVLELLCILAYIKAEHGHRTTI